MKKTNIRIRNSFVIGENKEYYLSTINDINKWKDINEEDLSDFKDEKVTEKLNKLINTLIENYKKIFFWPQGLNDMKYIQMSTFS